MQPSNVYRLEDVIHLVRSDIESKCSTTVSLGLEHRERTLLNEVICLRVQTASDRFKIFIKINSSGSEENKVHQEFLKTIAFRRFFEDSRPLFDSVEVLGYYEVSQAIALHGCRGDSLLASMQASCSWTAPSRLFADTLERADAVGRWLAYLERRTTEAGDPHEVADAMYAAAEEAVDRIRRHAFFRSTGPFVDLCRRTIEAIAPFASTNSIYIAHGDFHPGNFFVTDGTKRSVTAIDLTLSGPQFLGFDAVYFELQLLHFFSIRRYRPDRIRQVLRAFCWGYGRKIDPTSPTIRALRALLALKSLVYLSTIAASSSMLTKLSYCVDEAFLSSWTRRALS